MKAYVFSIGESTTDLCVELMKEYGFEVILYQDSSTLWDKLKRFYLEAFGTKDKMFVRIDADIIPNQNAKIIPKYTPNYPMWDCSVGWDWYKQDRGSISIHYMNRLAVELCLDHIDECSRQVRPETYLWRVPNINPFTKQDWTISRGMHGYAQVDQRERIKQLKHLRNQEYDWSLVERIEKL